MTSFSDWLKGAWLNLLTWFGLEEQKVASFLYPVFMDAKSIVKKDLLKDIIDGVPIVAAALVGGIAPGLAAAEGFILPVLKNQGLELAQTTINVLSNALVAQAQAAQASAAPAPLAA